MYVISLDGIHELGFGEVTGVVQDDIRGDSYLLGFHELTDACGRNLLADSVRQEYYKIVQERDVADAVTLYDIFQHDGVEDAPQIVPHLFVILQPNDTETGQTAVVEIGAETVIAVREPMEGKEFCITEALDGNLNITPAQLGADFARQHLGIAAGDDDVRLFLCMVADDGTLPFIDVLNLINEDVIALALNKVFFNVPAQVFMVLNEAELAFLLIYKDDVGFGFLFMTLDEVLQDKALADTSLAYQYDDISLANPRVNLVCIMLARDDFHCLYFYLGTKLVFLLFIDNKIGEYLHFVVYK